MQTVIFSNNLLNHPHSIISFWTGSKCPLVQALGLCTVRTAHRGSRGIALPFHDHGTKGGEGSASRPSRSLPLGKTRYPLYRRQGGPQDRSGWVRKISPPPGFDPRTVHSVASRYTDWATRPTNFESLCFYSITFEVQGKKEKKKLYLNVILGNKTQENSRNGFELTRNSPFVCAKIEDHDFYIERARILDSTHVN